MENVYRRTIGNKMIVSFQMINSIFVENTIHFVLVFNGLHILIILYDFDLFDHFFQTVFGTAFGNRRNNCVSIGNAIRLCTVRNHKGANLTALFIRLVGADGTPATFFFAAINFNFLTIQGNVKHISLVYAVG